MNSDAVQDYSGKTGVAGVSFEFLCFAAFGWVASGGPIFGCMFEFFAGYSSTSRNA